jgi:hypothetical protein
MLQTATVADVYDSSGVADAEAGRATFKQLLATSSPRDPPGPGWPRDEGRVVTPPPALRIRWLERRPI